MKNMVLIIVAVVFYATGVVAEEMKADLTVVLSGFESNAGKAMVALVNSKEAFEARKYGQKPVRSAAIKIDRLRPVVCDTTYLVVASMFVFNQR